MYQTSSLSEATLGAGVLKEPLLLRASMFRQGLELLDSGDENGF